MLSWELGSETEWLIIRKSQENEEATKKLKDELEEFNTLVRSSLEIHDIPRNEYMITEKVVLRLKNTMFLDETQWNLTEISRVLNAVIQLIGTSIV